MKLGYRATVAGIELDIETRSGLFSPRSLDAGTRHLIETTTFSGDDRVLDLGCGAGVVGIVAAMKGAEVVLLDKDPEALVAAEANAARHGVVVTIVRSDAFRDLDVTGFTQILTNPPYHADFAVPKHFIEKGFNRLAIGGAMRLVTQRVDWYRKKLAATFGGARELAHPPYTVFVAERRRAEYARHRRRTR